MLSLSSFAVEHELAYRRHQLEKAAHRARMLDQKSPEQPVFSRVGRPRAWRWRTIFG